MDHMNMDMGEVDEHACKISMLWNWYTVDSCFIARSWHVRSTGVFAASCIGVILLVVALEFLRRVSREYDTFLVRRFQRTAAATASSGRTSLTFRAGPLEQLARAALHAVTFGVAYFIMLLAMYYNGYIIICIFIGAGLGKFVCDWMVVQVPLAGERADDLKANDACETTLCCG